MTPDTLDITGIAARSTVDVFEPGGFTVTLAAHDAAALGVLPEIEFTAVQDKCWIEARHAESNEPIEIHWEPAEPESQRLAYKHGIAHPADSAIDLLVQALQRDEEG